MSNAKCVLFGRTALTVLLLSLCSYAHAQSPYGRAARQTIPFVIDQLDELGPKWTTEIDIRNPGSQPITVRLTYFGAVGTPKAFRLDCTPQTVGAFATSEFELRSACFLTPFGINFGRLELSALPEVPGPTDDPASLTFLTSARVSSRGGSLFTVEGFPQGNLSGNRRFAAVTGLKSGLVDGSQWRTSCYAAALNEPVPVFIGLVDGNGQPLGVVATSLDPGAAPPVEMQPFLDVFAAAGVPPGNYSNVTALFSTAGGGAGAGVFGLCRIMNTSFDKEAFEVAKYLDNNDEAREHVTSKDRTSYGETFSIVSEVPSGNDLPLWSNLHVAYFQHPDLVKCTVRFHSNPNLPFTDVGQVRLIDPDGNVAVNPIHAPSPSFILNLRDKSRHHAGGNGRWLIEVGADRAVKEGGCFQCLHSGSLLYTDYDLTCSSGNGHNQLDIVGLCDMSCVKDKTKGHEGEVLCSFANQVDSQTCYY
jgi:hypothetical protein